MTPAPIFLRQITAQPEPGGKPLTAFVALTDAEFAKFQTARPFSLVPYQNRIVSVVPRKVATEHDIVTARFAFAHVYGHRAFTSPLENTASPESGFSADSAITGDSSLVILQPSGDLKDTRNSKPR